MPSKKKGKNNNNDDDDLKQEGNVKVQAVLLADAVFGSKVTKKEDYQSFGLRPWSSEASTPSQILCPINNVPLVDYILDFLASNGVEQVIIITGSDSNSNTLEDYLEASPHRHKSSTLEFLFLKDTSLTNAGDALRELYKRNWIRASKQALPFLLVTGDVVADLDLRDAMKAHKVRQSHDSAAVMTVVLKPVQSQRTAEASIVPRVSELVVGLVGASSKTVATADAQASDPDPSVDDSKDYRILYYDNGGSSAGTTLPCSFLGQSQTQSNGPHEAGGLVVRHDLLDTGIAICSPDVLGRLEDEFDYLDLAHDFVTNSVAEEEDGLQTRIYAHVLEDASSDSNNNNNAKSGATRTYAARAVDFQTLHAISRDLLQRWAYPTVADNMAGADKRYKLVKVADHNHHNRNRRSNGLRSPLLALENKAAASSAAAASNKKDVFSQLRSSHKNNQYQYKEVLNPTKVGRTSVVVGPGMMGSHGSVGEDCLIARCVLGDAVTVGDSCKLVDCHLMNGVTIESGATLESCVVATNAIVKEGAILETGCYVGEGCVIGAGVTLKAFTRVTLAKDDDDDDWGDDDDDDGDWGDDSDDGSDDDSDDDDSNIGDAAKTGGVISSGGDCDRNLVGPDGKGKLWKPTLDDDDFSDDDDDADDEDAPLDPLQTLLQLQSIGGDPTPYYRREERKLAAREARDLEDDGFSDHEDDEDDDMMAETQAFSEFTGGTVTFGDDEDDDNDYLNYSASAAAADTAVIGRQKGIDVVREMTEICMEFNDECHPIENLAIELNSFKFSQNATYGDCASACLLSLLRKMEVSPAMSDGRLVSLLKAKLDKFWTGMFQKLCRGVEEELSILKALEHAATVDQQPPPAASEKSDPESTDALQKSTEIAQKLRSGMAFRFFLQTLHDQEVLSEEAILQWAVERRNAQADAEDPKQAVFQMQSVQDFLEWLEDDDSDDDSDDDDSDDSDDSD